MWTGKSIFDAYVIYWNKNNRAPRGDKSGIFLLCFLQINVLEISVKTTSRKSGVFSVGHVVFFSCYQCVYVRLGFSPALSVDKSREIKKNIFVALKCGECK